MNRLELVLERQKSALDQIKSTIQHSWNQVVLLRNLYDQHIEQSIQLRHSLKRRYEEREKLFYEQFHRMLDAISRCLQLGDNLKVDLICKTCWRLFEKPVLFWPCGHTICGPCLQASERERGQLVCVECSEFVSRQTRYMALSNKLLEKIIQKYHQCLVPIQSIRDSFESILVEINTRKAAAAKLQSEGYLEEDIPPPPTSSEILAAENSNFKSLAQIFSMSSSSSSSTLSSSPSSSLLSTHHAGASRQLSSSLSTSLSPSPSRSMLSSPSMQKLN
eukprot:TRINITY_DN6417_c0_g4_i1.p1 TRINITY_DN6417_c0_g4~~TRINITY_DN6417_c0_g4_i1.p1  ORF type:complete len:276 (-),score=37.95 TRINITY_DN6417_c0_g4_i1:20-847(-)